MSEHNNDNCRYILSTFQKILTEFKQKKQSKTEFYYQYQLNDKKQTLYEFLMYSHYITIESSSYDEAMILTTILRIIIDKKLDILINTEIKDFIDDIINSDELSKHADYKSIIAKDTDKLLYDDICNKLGFEIKKNRYYVFDVDNILNLLNDTEFVKYFYDTEYRLKKIFEIASCRKKMK